MEAKWPPIDEPSFRASLLDHLVRHSSLRANTGKDVLPALSTSMGRFCNLPANERYGFVLFEFVTFANGARVEEAARRRLRRDCGLAIYVLEEAGRRAFVAIYSRPRGAQATGQTYSNQQGSSSLQVIALPVPAKATARFRTAVEGEALRLRGAAWP